MSCPLYEDFTRNCIGRFQKIMHMTNLEFCLSDKCVLCPFYKILVEKRPYCEYVEDCSIRLEKQIKYVLRVKPELFKGVSDRADKYCHDEDGKLDCQIYKLKKQGKSVPNDMTPDGLPVIIE